MIRMRLVLLGLMAVLAFSAVAAATASAEPEFNPGSGSFTGKQIGTGQLEEANGSKIECTGGQSPGVISNKTQTGNVVVHFTGCSSSGIGCETSGASAKEIRTKTLKGELGLVTGNVAAEALEPTTGTIEAEFSCSILAFKVLGGVICTVSPTGNLQTTGKLGCEGTAKGVQKYTSFTGSSTKATRTVELITDEGSKSAKSDENATAEITYSAAIEIT